LSESQAIAWITQICDALAYLHSQNPPIIHRDVKPANIKIMPDGKTILVDFGIAKIYDPQLKTTMGARAVAPGYSPPEQYGHGTTDARSDVYALGATLYTLLTGREPIESVQRNSKPLPAPDAINPRLSKPLALVIQRAMDMDPNRRFQSVLDFKAALLQSGISPTVVTPVQQAGALPTPSTTGYSQSVSKKRKTVRPKPAAQTSSWLVALGGVIAVIACCIGAVGLWSLALPAQDAPPPTRAVLPSVTPTSVFDLPTLTPTRNLTSLPLAASPSPVLPPGVSPAPMSPTPVPPTPVPVTPSGDAKLGEPWEKDGVAINLVNVGIRTTSSYEPAAIYAHFTFLNKTGNKILVEWKTDDIYAEDSAGNKYIDWEGSQADSYWAEPGRLYEVKRYYSRIPKKESRIPSGTKFVTLIARQYSRLSNARWRIDINPPLAAITPPAGVKNVGESWQKDNVKIVLKKLDIRVGSSGSSAAVAAEFELSNVGPSRILVELDSIYFYVEDSFGVRFIDYDGGGMSGIWLDSKRTETFSQYYSAQAYERSRITSGSQFVILTIKKLGSIENARWKFDINR
jgi:serine/threonine protein kinase